MMRFSEGGSHQLAVRRDIAWREALRGSLESHGESEPRAGEPVAARALLAVVDDGRVWEGAASHALGGFADQSGGYEVGHEAS
jgi:hypothetical protein